jgi:hypothetical protein
MTIVYVLIAVAVLAVMLLGLSVRVITQFERGVVFRFGQLRPEIRGPGLALIVPFVDRLQKVNMQIITQPVPAQDGITRDNVTVRVDAVLYYRVVDPGRVAVDVQDYGSAILPSTCRIKVSDTFGVAASSYKIQWSDTSLSAGWTDFGLTISLGAGTSGITTASIANTVGHHRYWRIIYNSGTVSSNAWLGEVTFN